MSGATIKRYGPLLGMVLAGDRLSVLVSLGGGEKRLKGLVQREGKKGGGGETCFHCKNTQIRIGKKKMAYNIIFYLIGGVISPTWKGRFRFFEA